ncbi:MAG: type I secretion C-terminal target domain-containing protein, partial [Sedimenticola sp.]
GLDAESATSHTITVRADSSDGGFVTKDFTITVTNVDDNAPTLVDDDAANNEVAENASIGDTVGLTALGEDLDVGASITGYSLTDDAGGLFSIDSNGVVKVAGGLDAESATSHTITVRADSSDGGFVTKDFTINVLNVNEAPIITGTPNVSTNEDVSRLFMVSDFNFSDTDVGDTLQAVKIGVLPADGTFEWNNGSSWVAVSVGQEISATDIADGKLRFTPDQHESGVDYTDFMYQVSDGVLWSASATMSIDVTPVADTPILSPITDQYILTPGSTTISTQPGISQSNLELELGLSAGYLDNRFDPAGPNVTDPGTVNVNDGKLTTSHYSMTNGMEVTFDYIFTNGEDSAGEIAAGYNDLVVLVVTDPLGNQQSFLADSSEARHPAQNNLTGSHSYTASTAGEHKFDWLVLNARDGAKDSSLQISNAQFKVAGDSTDYGTPIAMNIHAALADTDGSETLSVTVTGVPAGARFTAGVDNGGGSWSFTYAELDDLALIPTANFTGTINLTVTATATESGNGDVAITSQTFSIVVDETDNTITSGSQSNQTINGSNNSDDLIHGYAGNDTIRGRSGDDLVFGGAGNDNLEGDAGNDTLYGGVGNDTLEGESDNDTLYGGSGDDILVGGSGDDLLLGNIGDDTLTGDGGQDKFVWKLGEQGTTASPAEDVVTDFTVGSGGDILDLSDMLIDEQNHSLTDYLHFTYDGSQTVVEIDHDGGGAFNHTQEVILQGIDLTNGGTLTDQQIIDTLLADGNLIVDV